MKIQARSRLVFTGDSVTDVDRARPFAEGLFNPLGNGYPNIVAGMLTAVYPELMIRVTNTGTSGNTSADLLQRFDEEVLALNPDWLSIMIGINDVWRQFDVPQIPEQSVSLADYEKNLDCMLAKATAQVKGGIILMTPYYIESNAEDAMRKTMDAYGAVCRKLAEKYQTLFIDTQAVMLELLKHTHSAFWAWDRVHPNFNGHTAIARKFLQTIDFDFNR